MLLLRCDVADVNAALALAAQLGTSKQNPVAAAAAAAAVGSTMRTGSAAVHYESVPTDLAFAGLRVAGSNIDGVPT